MPGDKAPGNAVAPLAGAWIEILSLVYLYLTNSQVAPTLYWTSSLVRAPLVKYLPLTLR